jgi:hypothetical protein
VPSWVSVWLVSRGVSLPGKLLHLGRLSIGARIAGTGSTPACGAYAEGIVFLDQRTDLLDQDTNGSSSPAAATGATLPTGTAITTPATRAQNSRLCATGAASAPLAPV